jgi:hypothetical protein
MQPFRVATTACVVYSVVSVLRAHKRFLLHCLTAIGHARLCDDDELARLLIAATAVPGAQARGLARAHRSATRFTARSRLRDKHIGVRDSAMGARSTDSRRRGP